MIIWDLFGGGQNSVYHTVKEHELDATVYTFDITKMQHAHQVELDLSADDVIEQLKAFPQPDIIVASPLGQSFSKALAVKGSTVGWKVNKDNSISLRTLDEIEYAKSNNNYMKHWKADVMLARAQLGKKCLDNTLAIIEYFKPKYWYIENPRLSLMWNYTKFNKDIEYFYNYADYSAYGFLAQKPTCFLSNIKLELKIGGWMKASKETIDGVKYLVFPNGQKVRWSNNRAEMIKRLNESCMNFIQENEKQTIGDKSSKQFKEAEATSAIPHDLIWDIISQFTSNSKKWYYINKELKYL